MEKLIAIETSASCKLSMPCVVKPSYSFSIRGTSIDSAVEPGQRALIEHFTAICTITIFLR